LEDYTLHRVVRPSKVAKSDEADHTFIFQLLLEVHMGALFDRLLIRKALNRFERQRVDPSFDRALPLLCGHVSWSPSYEQFCALLRAVHTIETASSAAEIEL
ncbi:unnamed protein product, partial [Scytosiphon promiscuus]